MVCPNCGGKCVVVDTATNNIETYRKRKCKECNYAFYTIEKIDTSETARINLSDLRNRIKINLDE